MVRNYLVCLPSVAGSIEVEWEQCLNQLTKSGRGGYRLIKLNIFTSLPDYQSFIKIKKYIGESIVKTFEDHCPAFGITIHPPEKPWKVSVEGLFVPDTIPGIETKFLASLPYVVINSKSSREVWGAGLGDDLFMDDTRKAANAAFEKIIRILESESLTMNHIIRQWNYIGNILEVKNGLQNYQVFNEVRSEFYKKYRNVPGFPAATGVGMKHGGVFLDFCAIETDETLKIKAIDNPNQVNAYEYDQKVLKGLVIKGKSTKHPPQFERALLLANKSSFNLFISGTASIIGQKTIGKGDVKEQTIVTIENIKKLTDSERIGQLTGSEYLSNGKFNLVRVYIKNSGDFDEVKKICSEHYPQVPAIFIESDICRDDLLTEIEAEYIP